jgi:phospholipid/cholesterol/gamma-HCH transport system substrate-binding protein
MRTTDLTPRSRLRFGALGTALLCGALAASYLAVRDGHSGSSELRASFGRAGEGLDTKSDVKIRGVRVGRVAGVRLTGGGRAMVTLRLNKGIRVPEGSEAAVAPLSVFGPKYIDLRPGPNEGSGPYLADGATIAKTTDPQELTDIAAPTVNLLDALGPQDMATILRALGTGLNGRGTELGGLIDDSAKLLALTSRRGDDIGRLLDDGGALAATGAAHGREIGGVTGDVNKIVPSVTGDPAQFTKLLNGLDSSARTLDRILASDPGAVGRIISSVVPAGDVLYRYRRYFPDLISSSGSILTQLAGIAVVPGPHKTLLSRVTIHINPSNALCETLPGICSPVEPAIPEDPNAKRKGGN